MNWKIIWRSLGHHEMRKRIFAVLAILLIFRIMAHIPVPISNAQDLQQVLHNVFSSNSSQLLSFINVLSGGALASFSIAILGLGPYINASIIMQLLTKAIPQLEAMHKEGEYGQRKINQYTRIITFPLAAIQSVGAIYLIRQTAQSVGGLTSFWPYDTRAVGAHGRRANRRVDDPYVARRTRDRTKHRKRYLTPYYRRHREWTPDNCQRACIDTRKRCEEVGHSRG